jgi:hypothetical protein
VHAFHVLGDLRAGSRNGKATIRTPDNLDNRDRHEHRRDLVRLGRAVIPCPNPQFEVVFMGIEAGDNLDEVTTKLVRTTSRIRRSGQTTSMPGSASN